MRSRNLRWGISVTLVLFMLGCQPQEQTANSPSLSTLADTTPSDLSETGPSTIYTVEPGGSNLRQISPGRMPQFSNDGKYLSFVQSKENHDLLVLLDRETEATETFDFQHSLSQYAWSPDSSYIAVTIRQGVESELHLIALPSGEAQTISHAQDLIIGGWSSDSRYLLWADRDDSGIDAAIVLYDVGPQRTFTLLEWSGTICDLDWSTDNSQIVFVGSDRRNTCLSALSSLPMEETRQSLYRLTIDSSELVQVTDQDEVVATAARSPSDNLMAYLEVMEGGLVTLHLIDLDDGVDRYTTDMGISVSLLWSPDGSSLAVGGATHATMIDVATLSRRTLLGGPATYAPAGWSPDGQDLLIISSCCGLSGFSVVTTGIPGTAYGVYDQLSQDPPFTAEDPVWSPDARLIAFSGFNGCRGCP